MEFFKKIFGEYIENAIKFVKYSQGFLKRHSLGKNIQQEMTNGIKDMAGLEEKVEDMYGKQRGIAEAPYCACLK